MTTMGMAWSGNVEWFLGALDSSEDLVSVVFEPGMSEASRGCPVSCVLVAVRWVIAKVSEEREARDASAAATTTTTAYTDNYSVHDYWRLIELETVNRGARRDPRAENRKKTGAVTDSGVLRRRQACERQRQRSPMFGEEEPQEKHQEAHQADPRQTPSPSTKSLLNELNEMWIEFLGFWSSVEDHPPSLA
ncbi:hypothetical protein HYFRA_00004608 [Hymenoscyphus fraxineus]|uniref:Uncharacterized protein n=1 Tax=Hymenoscyphus fraxineus TaxID=746836 RepID=A0A9N9KVS3_9HELO|nr:hypothetical protein HYFRA_00004608 [Hymenoscyphus fraxineus]